MKRALLLAGWGILFIAGCTPHVAPSQPWRDEALKQSYVRKVRHWLPQDFVIRQRVILRQGQTEAPFELFAQVHRTGALRLQARGDFGAVWFDVQAKPGTGPRVLHNDTPFPDAMLLEGLLADQQLAWLLPNFSNATLRQYASGETTLQCPHNGETWEYLFQKQTVHAIRQLRDGRIQRRVDFILNNTQAPQHFTVVNHRQNYTLTADIVSLKPRQTQK